MIARRIGYSLAGPDRRHSAATAMTDPTHPANPAAPADPDTPDAEHDWRRELDWPLVRRLVRLHGLYWAYGALLAALYYAGVLTGATRTVLGLAVYLGGGALLVLSMRIVARPRRVRGGRHFVSGRTFLILLAFMASLFAYVGLLELIDLGTIELL